MKINFYNRPAAPAIASLASAPSLASVAWPGKATAPNLPSTNFPANVPAQVNLSVGDIALRAALDIRPRFLSPVLTTSLLGLFRSVLFAQTTGNAGSLTIKSSYRHMPSNWKRIFSETISSGIALTLSERVADFPYFVPLEFCKTGALPATRKWPAAIASLVPGQFEVNSRWGGLMPDYIVARLENGVWKFATVESKGRDSAVHTAKYGEYSKFKIQSMNAQLVPNPAFMGPAPAFAAHFLGVTAIRGKAVRTDTRSVRARWFNHRQMDDIADVPDRWGVEFVAGYYSAILFRLGFTRLGNALGAARLEPERQRDGSEDLGAILNGADISSRFGLYETADHIFSAESLSGGVYRPVITEKALDAVKLMMRALRERDSDLYREVNDLLFGVNRSVRELSQSEDFSTNVGRRMMDTKTARLSLSTSGVGLVTEDLDLGDAEF
ncbi:hypothetical protein [Paraburkholderia bannensis]|uniref:hypothetical protein n=1 Tax=Paraburkholderia bannensis TaxID=765414 RepID=UPI002AC34D97|nr:hypothetical protein [Paraburkholderia bannensis]